MEPFFYLKPRKIGGVFKIPPSKSHTLRAILFAAFSRGISHIRNALSSPDTQAMLNAIRSFGAECQLKEDSSGALDLVITGIKSMKKSKELVIDAGNSGQVLRFAGALSTLVSEKVILTGDLSIKNNRPVKELVSGLHALGVSTNYLEKDGHPPLLLQGSPKAGVTTLSAEDSQPLSALLLLAPHLSGKTIINVTKLGERPWIDLTLDWLQKRGVRVINENYQRFIVEGPVTFEPFDYVVPGDFSSAAFPAAAALITQSEVVLEGLDFNDIQGDKAFFDLIEQMGAGVEKHPHARQVRVFYQKPLQGITADLNDLIDALPVLAALCCFATTKSRLYNVQIARSKESDRLKCIAENLKKMGAELEEEADALVIHPSMLKGAILESCFDHRIAMALAVAAFGVGSPTLLFDVECIEKSYPGFDKAFQLRVPKKIALIGHKHAGKTTLGELISKRTGLPFYDTDQELLKCFPQFNTVRELYCHLGEKEFRSKEKSLFKKLSLKSEGVVALGGGTLESPECIDDLDRFDEVHHLFLTFEEWVSRLEVCGVPSYLDAENLVSSALPVYMRRQSFLEGYCGK